jgi:hypothetical protein
MDFTRWQWYYNKIQYEAYNFPVSLGSLLALRSVDCSRGVGKAFVHAVPLSATTNTILVRM